ncbi:LysR family transcriptional regulator [Bradyrhizobium sp. 166]|uniref:LysR family transcriptional regulator n=1 Tax=Bradyrhizobium sp. 166 TaxID=2782638 RepID=UPI001FFB88E4|nr:LysR family transcriptional regulator [Bradyrhizobium sp. 166]MCK1606535.1 LysR family transcriptional regulator [Bradyrhizobium sp. 166]
MRLRDIETFSAVMQTGSISAAARLLNVSQSAVSQLLIRAEGRLGFRLFERIRGKLVATLEGRLLYAEAQKAMDAVDLVQALARNLRVARSDQVRVAATDPLAMALLPNVLSELASRFPGLKINLRVLHRRELIRELLSQNIDLGFMFEPAAHPAISTRLLGATHFTLAVGETEFREMAAAYNSKAVPLDFLDGRTIVTLPWDLPPGSLLFQAFKSANIEIQSEFDVHTSYLAIAMVQANGGYAMVDGVSAVSSAQSGMHLFDTSPQIPIRIGAVWSESREQSALTGIICDCVSHQLDVLNRELRGAQSSNLPSERRHEMIFSEKPSKDSFSSCSASAKGR